VYPILVTPKRFLKTVEVLSRRFLLGRSEASRNRDNSETKQLSYALDDPSAALSVSEKLLAPASVHFFDSTSNPQ